KSRSRSSVSARRFSTFATRFECTFCHVSLVAVWETLEHTLPSGLASARIEMTVTEHDAERAASLLAPAQPRRAATGVLRFDVARDGTALTPGAVRRLLGRLDEAGLDGTLAVLSSQAKAPRTAIEERSLAEQWDDGLTQLP